MYVGKGLGAIKEANEGGTSYLKLADGESTIVRLVLPIEEVESIYEHTEQFNGRWTNIRCLGKDNCPICKAGKNASFRSYLVVYDRKDGKVKVFKASKTVGKTIVGLAEEYGDLTKRDFKITRSGSSLKTIYQFFPRDPEAFDTSELELPNIEELIQPKSVEEIVALMTSTGEVSDLNESKGLSDDVFPF